VFDRGFIAELPLMGTFWELMLDFAEEVVAMRPVPVALIAGAERVLLRSDRRAYGWQSRADNSIVVGALTEHRELATAPASPEPVRILGGETLHYRAGSQRRQLRFSEE
jgi:hypothetical protein